ncbi:MAG TPA: amidohydrolase family protein, partial [Halanaerobiales bacterium]|nr:amidohydrolase family protein [Halanaerobiales bacterium]
LNKRINLAENNSIVDFAFYGAAGFDRLDCIEEIAKSNIVAFKTFLQDPQPGREKEFIGLTMRNDGEIWAGFEKLAKTNKVCAFHAENNEIIKYNIRSLLKDNKTDYFSHALARPPITEILTVEKLIRLADYFDLQIEFVHISTVEAVRLIKSAKQKGQDIILETCPHYLFKSEEDLKKLGPYANCNPPLRSIENRDNLWKYINDGTIDIIGSDHAPYLLEEKEKGLDNIFNAPAGFPGIEMRLPLMLNAVLEGKLEFSRCIELLSENPAKIFNMYPQKGLIETGSDADLVILDLNEKYVIKKENFYTKAKNIAHLYDNTNLKGEIKYTIVRGNIVYCNNNVNSDFDWGKLVSIK